VLGELYAVALASAIKLMIDWICVKTSFEKLKKVQFRIEFNFIMHYQPLKHL